MEAKHKMVLIGRNPVHKDNINSLCPPPRHSVPV